jgi:plasmid stabilization system protein ParE
MIARDDPPGTPRAIRFTARASEEVRLAFDWYDVHAPGVGPAFLNTLEAVLAQAAAYPESFPLVRPRIRRALLRRFPYGVFYVVQPDSVLVLAVVHACRDPETWPREAAG